MRRILEVSFLERHVVAFFCLLTLVATWWPVGLSTTGYGPRRPHMLPFFGSPTSLSYAVCHRAHYGFTGAPVQPHYISERRQLGRVRCVCFKPPKKYKYRSQIALFFVVEFLCNCGCHQSRCPGFHFLRRGRGGRGFIRWASSTHLMATSSGLSTRMLLLGVLFR